MLPVWSSTMAVAADTNSVRRSRKKSPAVAVIVAVVTICAALETVTYVVYNHPGLLTLPRSNIITIAFRSLYRAQVPLVQWEPACSQYNATAGNFTLRPGRCRHITPEFSVEISANSMGLRDSEGALTGPDVIVLGASLAMGWGIEERDTIARRVEHATGLRVLNAAVPGYALRQSLSLLTHLDRSRLRYLVISYFLPQDTRNIRETLRQGSPPPSTGCRARSMTTPSRQ
jgi:hypothetical protein